MLIGFEFTLTYDEHKTFVPLSHIVRVEQRDTIEPVTATVNGTAGATIFLTNNSTIDVVEDYEDVVDKWMDLYDEEEYSTGVLDLSQ